MYQKANELPRCYSKSIAALVGKWGCERFGPAFPIDKLTDITKAPVGEKISHSVTGSAVSTDICANTMFGVTIAFVWNERKMAVVDIVASTYFLIVSERTEVFSAIKGCLYFICCSRCNCENLATFGFVLHRTSELQDFYTQNFRFSWHAYIFQKKYGIIPE